MIRDFKRGEDVTTAYYELRFYRDGSGGFAFPCDETGKLLVDKDTNPAAIENYNWCLEHPEKFPYDFNRVVRYERTWREPNTGTCYCGQKMELVNEYMGACECPKCGKWYNIWGQELKNPNTWSEGDDW